MNSTPHSPISEQHLDAEIHRFLTLRETNVGALPTADDSVRALTARLTGAPRRTPWGRSILSATGLIAIVAIVALGTGALLLAPQGPAHLPAGEVISPSPSLVTEEVEPGVVRVLSDRAGHDLTTSGVRRIVVDSSGDVWMLGRSGLFRLGGPETFPDGDGGGEIPPLEEEWGMGLRPNIGELSVAVDGTVWALGRGNLSSFDGRSWTNHPSAGPRRNAVWFAMVPDGSAWAAWEVTPLTHSRLGRFDGQAWSYPDVTDRSNDAELGYYGPGLAVTPDGSLWVSSSVTDSQSGALLHVDGETREIVEAPIAVDSLSSESDGSVWVADEGFSWEAQPPLRLARFDGKAWVEYAAPGWIQQALRYWDENHLPPVIASDGSAWVRTRHTGTMSWEGWETGSNCDGLARFDGTGWSTYLSDTCVIDIAPGSDGSVWVATFRGDDSVFLIRPDAAEEAQ